jgi:hypothetical protein
VCNSEERHLETHQRIRQRQRHVFRVGIRSDSIRNINLLFDDAEGDSGLPLLIACTATRKDTPSPCQKEKKRMPLTQRNLASMYSR